MRRAFFPIRAWGPLLATALAQPGMAFASPTPTPGATAAPAAAKLRTKRVAPAAAPEVPPAPPPELRATLDTPSPDGPWTLHLDNTGSVPLRVLADARLLSFEIVLPEPEAAADDDRRRKVRPPRPVRCDLPSSMRPHEYDERALVVPGGRSYVEKLDPRVFCFGTRAAAALVPGAKVVAHLVGTREVPAVEPVDEVEPKVASVLDLAGAPATIEPPAPPAPPSKETGAAPPLSVSTPAFVDFRLGWEAEIETTVTDNSPRSEALLLRPETVVFEVTGPSGVGVTDPSPTVRCAWPGQAPAPIPEAYTHLATRQQASIAVLLSALCPDGTLRRPGLYLVRARLDTRNASGASVGVRTFTGEVQAARPTRLRVREQGGTPSPSSRPQLAPPPAPAAR